MIVLVLALITLLQLIQAPSTYIVVVPGPVPEPIEYVIGFLELARGGFVCEGSICVEWHNDQPVML